MISKGYILTIALVLITLVLWSLSPGFSAKFRDIGSITTAIGEMMGLVGLTLLSVAVILSARLRFTENLFGGMNRVYIAHHLIGGTAFLIILTHPLFLSISYLEISPRAAAMFLLPGSDWPTNYGRIALYSIMILLILTYYVRLPYQVWRFTHKFLGAAFLFAGLHGMTIASDVTVNLYLRGYLLVLIVCALSAYVYRTLLGRYFVRRTPYIVTRVTPLAQGITEIVLRPRNRPIRYHAGQFMFITFQQEPMTETHPFSITSPPRPDQLSLSAKSLGDYTRQLPAIKPGTVAQVEGPYGAFTQEEATQPKQVWIAGGIGVTPFLSMARSMFARGPLANTQGDPLQSIRCIYAVGDDSEAAYLKELQAIAKKSSTFTLHTHFSKQQGRLDAKTVEKANGGLGNTDIFICGPPAMMYGLKQQFRGLGVPRARIHTEEFTLL